MGSPFVYIYGLGALYIGCARGVPWGGFVLNQRDLIVLIEDSFARDKRPKSVYA